MSCLPCCSCLPKVSSLPHVTVSGRETRGFAKLSYDAQRGDMKPSGDWSLSVQPVNLSDDWSLNVEPVLWEHILSFLPSRACVFMARTSHHLKPRLGMAHWSFEWLGGDPIVTGEYGWIVKFGLSERLRHDAAQFWWAVELRELKGLLALGVADQQMPDNVFLGVESFGRWNSWGWELYKTGRLEAVDASRATSRVCSTPGLDLRPSPRNSIILIVVADLKRSRLELYVRGGAAAATAVRFVDSVPLAGVSGVEAQSTLRPTVCADIGATVRLLDASEF